MDRRTFANNALCMVGSALLAPLASAAETPAVANEKAMEQSKKMPADTKTQEQAAKRPGDEKAQEQSQKAPGSNKSMESSKKSPMKMPSSDKGALYAPEEAERKRRLALEHLAARRIA
jgi:hypothetical protein